jgi:hypothetical protein
MDSAKTIVTDACTIAKAPGFLSTGGRFLQSTLNDLALHRNLKSLLTKTPVTLIQNSNGPFSLPLDYLRPYDFTYTILGYTYEMEQIDLEKYDLLFKDQSVANFPIKFATDLSGDSAIPPTAPLVYVYPQSNATVTATLRYFKKIAEMAAPLETNVNVPWFEDQEYLRCDVARQLFAITDDERSGEFGGPEGLCERLLRKHLLMEGDEQKVVKPIRLDPNTFRPGGRLRATKATIW